MRKILTALALLCTLTACATAQKLGAATDVHALLVSIRDNDSQTFDAHVDHDALKKQLSVQLDQRMGQNKKVRQLAALLGPSVVEFADQALIQPKTFKMVAEQYGYTPEMKIPNSIAIATVLKPLPDGRVCATKKKDGPCLLVFTKEAGVWKLSSFEGDFSMLRLKL